MSVIIRLQNLPWSASSVDIRKFFEGLSIPEGGVHIVGGELGDAFIAFSTDEDARQAFERNNRPLKQVQIKLALSSRTEMQKVIEEARTKPFLQSVQQTQQLPGSLVNKVPVAPQAPIITSLQKDKQSSPRRDDIKDKDTRSRNRDREDSKSRDRDDSKNRRDRSRRRSKSRSRSRDRRDRSRDRRDRRRRDRSRSKDRRDSRDNRRRDNRRSKSRERDRSRDRRSTDKNNVRRKSDTKTNEVIEIKDDGPSTTPRIWEQKPNLSTEISQGILGNFPGQIVDDTRRTLGILSAALPNNPSGNQMNRFPRNDNNSSGTGNRDNNNWQQRKGRFPDSNNDHASPLLNQFQHGMRPNMMGNIGGEMRPHMFQHNQHGMRMPFNHNQDNGFNFNRPFLSRPGTIFPEPFRSQEHQQFNMQQQDRTEDFRNKRHDNNKDNCCVQVRPYFGGYGEIRKFFSGIFISNTGVKFVMNEFGKRTGIVYIKFVRSDGKEQALQRTGLMLRGVPIEVKHLDDDEWERCGENNINTDDHNESRNEENRNSPHSESKQKSSSFTCAVVDDIPEFVKEHDILKMFSDYEIVSVHIAINKQYRHLAYVQFTKEEDAAAALANKTSHVISGKPVTVRPISEETFNEVERKHANGELVDTNFDSNKVSSSSPRDSEFPVNGSVDSDSHIITDCVVLNGLPPKTTDRDVLDFFSDIGIVPLKIHIMHTQFGPSGDAYCEFKSCDDAICALDKNSMPLGAGTIRVELVYRRDMDRALGIPTGPPLLAQPMQGPRFQANRFGPRGPNMLGPRGPPHLMRRRPPGPNMNMRYDGPMDGMGPKGCVVSMENVPFKAGVHEILEFFEGYELEGQNVFRRFNDNGAPTGDARVTFNTADQARRAVEECNRLKIRDRTVFLRLL